MNGPRCGEVPQFCNHVPHASLSLFYRSVSANWLICFGKNTNIRTVWLSLSLFCSCFFSHNLSFDVPIVKDKMQCSSTPSVRSHPSPQNARVSGYPSHTNLAFLPTSDAHLGGEWSSRRCCCDLAACWEGMTLYSVRLYERMQPKGLLFLFCVLRSFLFI